MDDPTLFPAWAFPLLPVALWCLIVWSVSYLSGWQRLAERYRATLPVYGKRWDWQSGNVGWASYGGVLILTTNAQGLFMEVFFLFGLGHPRLFIPWRDFHQVERKDLLWQHEVRVKVGSPATATLRLPVAVFEQSEGRHLLPERTQ
jgi:hypothetical protein